MNHFLNVIEELGYNRQKKHWFVNGENVRYTVN